MVCTHIVTANKKPLNVILRENWFLYSMKGLSGWAYIAQMQTVVCWSKILFLSSTGTYICLSNNIVSWFSRPEKIQNIRQI